MVIVAVVEVVAVVVAAVPAAALVSVVDVVAVAAVVLVLRVATSMGYWVHGSKPLGAPSTRFSSSGAACHPMKAG